MQQQPALAAFPLLAGGAHVANVRNWDDVRAYLVSRCNLTNPGAIEHVRQFGVQADDAFVLMSPAE